MITTLLLSFLCIAIFNSQASMVPTDTYYQIKYTDFQGLQIKTAVFTAEFDQELSTIETIPCAHCSCNETTQYNNICDYTNTRGACGTTLDSLSTCPDAVTACDTSLNPWEDLIEGQSLSSSVEPGEWKHFRFLINQTCTAFGIKVTVSSGNPFVFLNTDLSVALTDPQSNPIQSITDAHRPLYFTMCPYHPDFIVGTYYISVIGVLSQSNFSITAHTESINDTSSTKELSHEYSIRKSANNTCSSTSHECLLEDIPYEGICSEAGLQYFVFEYMPETTSCEIFSFGIRAFGSSREVDLYASRIYEYPYFGNQTEWSSYNVYDDWITASVCMTAGNVTTFYLTVECWSDNDTFVLSASTKPSQLGKPLSQLDAYSGIWELSGSAFFVYDTSADIYAADNTLRCDEWRYTCTNFWFGFSNNRTTPFWPMPPVLSSYSNAFRSIHQLLTYDGDTSDLGSKVSMIVVLSITPTNGATQIYLDESYLESAGFVFSNKLVNSNLEPVEGTYTFSKRDISCSFPDFQEFNQINEQLIDLMGTTYDATSLNVLQYQIGITQFYDEWFGCLELLNTLLKYEEEPVLVNTTGCFKTLDDPAYYEDPCCYPLPSWYGVCYPTVNNISTELPQSYDSAVVKKTCRNPKCSESFLEDYANYQNYQITLSTSSLVKDKENAKETDLGCSTGQESQSDTIVNAATTAYRTCKDSIYSINSLCYQDSDCTRDNTTFSCDMLTHTCQIPRSFQDMTFVECLVSAMNSYQKQYISGLYNISTSDANFTGKYYEALLEYDCMDPVGPVTFMGSHYYLQMYDQLCASSYGCPYVECLDASCEIEENACLTWCEEKGWSFVTSTEDECLSQVFCNWNSTLCDGEDLVTCQSLCSMSQDPAEYFCGLCEGDQCIEFGLNQTECQTAPVCILPDGGYVINVTDAECLNFQTCNGNCQPECRSSLYAENGICYNSQINSAECSVTGGTYNYTTCIYYNESRDNCSFVGTWASCLDISLSDCFECSQDANSQSCTDANFSIAQSLLLCRIDSQITCSNHTQCENSGECSVNPLLWDGTGDSQYGACVVPRLEPVGTYFNLFLYPFCDASSGQVAVPNGCIDYTLSKSDCLNGGYQWSEPKFNEDDCISEEGCLDVFDELYTVGLQYAFSPKNQSECLSQYNSGQWTSYYKWNSATWTSGVQRNLTWVQRQAKYSHSWSEVVSFTEAENSFVNGAISEVAIETKSTVLCENSKLQQTLVAIACDCGEDGGGKCFTDNVAVAAGQAKICAGTASSITTAIASLSVFENSVSQSCSDVFLSEISIEEFRQTVQPTLSSGFASFKKPNSFAIYNSKDSEIGSLLGSGIQIEFSDSVTLYELCLSITQDIPKDYKVWDFASADSKYDTLTPVGISVSQESAEKAKSQKILCVNLTIDSSKVNYFPIIRIDNWETAEVPLLGDTSLGLVYTLAVLFLVVAVFCIIKLGIDIYHMVSENRKKPDLAFFVILFIFMFNLIRSIHFFLLPTGVDNTVVDFFLVVLPTFFYFSAFSLVIVVWGVVCSNTLTRSFNQSVKYIARFSIIVNVLLYLLLVAIVTAFAVETSGDDSSPCMGRISTQSDDSVVKSLSITYSVVVAVISFAVGFGFLVFGGRLYIQLTKSGRKANQRKIILVTIACSVGFMLHCIFIVVASTLDEPIVVFSFLGLIITEIVPSLFLLSMFNQFRKKDETSSNNAGSTRKTRSIISASESKDVEMREATISVEDTRTA